MNYEHYIAKRISLSGNKSFTGIIVKIAILAIALSMTIMIVTTAVITGFKKEISEKIISFWGDIHVSDANISRTLEQIPIDNASAIINDLATINSINYEATKKILGIPIKGQLSSRSTKGGIKSVQGTIMAPGLLRTKDLFHGILLKGVGADFDWGRMEGFMKEGEIISFSDTTASDAIILSSTIANKLNTKIGDRLNISFIKEGDHIKRRFTVSGIYNTGLEEYDSKIALIDIKKLVDLLDWEEGQVGNIEVLLDYKEDRDVISEYIYYEVLPANLYSTSIEDKFVSIFQWLKLQDINENVILFLMILVGMINMITVLLILILERSKMIGVLKSLGADNWSIRKIFLYNASYIIGFGMLIGNVVALLFCFIQKKYGLIKLDEASYYLSEAPIHLDLTTFALINVGTFIILLLIMLIPTILVSWIYPVKVLRFD